MRILLYISGCFLFFSCSNTENQRPSNLIDNGAEITILGNGNINKPVEVKAHMFSKSAVEKLEKAGGKAIYQC